MAHDGRLADRVRKALGRQGGLTEKKKIGGISFKLWGNMCCGVLKDDHVVRVGPEQNAKSLAEPHARPMDFTCRPLEGIVYVGPVGLPSDQDLAKWVNRGFDFAGSPP
jgi:hypothetical protein